tara:strand:+ start:118 stop:324 length:207 start_codon:yes stop_codon:yes gene_type:complete
MVKRWLLVVVVVFLVLLFVGAIYINNLISEDLPKEDQDTRVRAEPDPPTGAPAGLLRPPIPPPPETLP